MLILENGKMIGAVSGGCVEGAVMEEAKASLKDRKPRLLKFGVADDIAWDVGLTCGGRIHVYVEPLDLDWWRLTSQAQKKDQSLTTITILEGDATGAMTSVADADLLGTEAAAGLAAQARRRVAAAPARNTGNRACRSE